MFTCNTHKIDMSAVLFSFVTAVAAHVDVTTISGGGGVAAVVVVVVVTSSILSNNTFLYCSK